MPPTVTIHCPSSIGTNAALPLGLPAPVSAWISTSGAVASVPGRARKTRVA
ncbi:Uncharacterised protein [Mycobacteroides abscessus subsp. abscessus]|nr:Uncharacterised protein [Mycobacteroides abscessus subsp. abscessus]